MKPDLHLDHLIAEYLRHNPDFFKHHIDLLDSLYVTPPLQQGVLSLVEMQLERQRERIKELENGLDKLTKLARQDRDIFSALMPLQHQLANARTFHEGIEALNHWAQSWDLQQAKILLVRDKWQMSHSIAPQYWLDSKAFEIICLERFGFRRLFLGALTLRELHLLFLPNEMPIGSLSACLLNQPSNALLLFTSPNPNQFHSSQDTKFLKHLVDIVELHLNRWLFTLQV